MQGAPEDEPKVGSHLLCKLDRECRLTDTAHAQQGHQPTPVAEHPLLKNGQFKLTPIKRCDIRRLSPIGSTQKKGWRGKSRSLRRFAIMSSCMELLE